MKFKGTGIIWNPSKGKVLVNFSDVDEYETDDKGEIAILDNCINVECIDKNVSEVVDVKPIDELKDVEDKPKKRRKRRTKEEIEADKIKEGENE